MSLRVKIPLLLAGLLAACVLVVVLVEDGTLRSGFAAIEAQAARDQASRVREGVDGELRTLRLLTRLQSVWDDPYEHLIARDAAAFADDYPPSDLATSYALSDLLVVDSDGAVVAGGRVASGPTFGPARAAIAAATSRFAGAPDFGVCGLWRADTVLLYCTHPVLHGDGSGPPAGWLTLFQELDGPVLDGIGKRLGLPLVLADPVATSRPAATGATVTDAPANAADVATVTALDDDHLRIAVPLAVANDAAGAAVSVETARPVNVQGTRARHAVLLWVGGIGLVLMVVVGVLLELFVLRRVRRASEAMRAVRSGADDRLDDRGRDELARMAALANEMIAALHERSDDVRVRHETAQRALSQAESVVGAAVESVLANLTAVEQGTQRLTDATAVIGRLAGSTGVVSGEAVDTAERARRTMDELRASTEAIDQVATFIAGIADETNVLALNATIEAARAGATGRGFAVVANEVKELALRTKDSTQQIAGDVQAMRDRVTAMDAVVAAIAGLTRKVDEATSGIADATQEQSGVLADVGHCVGEAGARMRALAHEAATHTTDDDGARHPGVAAEVGDRP